MKACQCEYAAHVDHDHKPRPLTPNRNPSHRYGQQFADDYVTAVRTTFGIFDVCKAIAHVPPGDENDFVGTCKSGCGSFQSWSCDDYLPSETEPDIAYRVGSAAYIEQMERGMV